MRTCRVVVQSSTLAFRPSFSRMPSPSESTQPASSRISGLGRVERRRGLVREEPGVGRDVGVGNLDGAAQEPAVDLVLVDRVAKASRMAGSAIGQPSPRSATVGLREQPPVLVQGRTGLPTSSGGGTRTPRAGIAETVAEVLDLRQVGILEVGGEVELAGLEAGDHEVGVAVPLEDQVVEMGRLGRREARVAGRCGQPELLLRRVRFVLERARDRDARATSARKPEPLTRLGDREMAPGSGSATERGTGRGSPRRCACSGRRSR